LKAKIKILFSNLRTYFFPFKKIFAKIHWWDENLNFSNEMRLVVFLLEFRWKNFPGENFLKMRLKNQFFWIKNFRQMPIDKTFVQILREGEMNWWTKWIFFFFNSCKNWQLTWSWYSRGKLSKTQVWLIPLPIFPLGLQIRRPTSKDSHKKFISFILNFLFKGSDWPSKIKELINKTKEKTSVMTTESN